MLSNSLSIPYARYAPAFLGRRTSEKNAVAPIITPNSSSLFFKNENNIFSHMLIASGEASSKNNKAVIDSRQYLFWRVFINYDE